MGRLQRRKKSRHFLELFTDKTMMKRSWPQVKYKYKTSCAGSKNKTEDPFLLEDEKKWRKNTSTPPPPARTKKQARYSLSRSDNQERNRGETVHQLK